MYQLGIDETLVSSTCDFKLGQLGMNDGSSAVYKWVQYDTGAGSVAAVAGQVAYYYTIALTAGADGDPLTPTGSGDGTLDVSGAVTDNVCAIAGDISDKEIACDFPF